ncbi:MAG: phosphatidylglycerophosphatase A [Desulfobacterales bacterium]|nr:MAG: phosphatidylglycerophosphatase A [Desulfobacterales bacterium]
MNFGEKVVIFLATGGFIGNIPFAPGTFGSFLGLPLSYLLSKMDAPSAALGVALFILGAIGISHGAERILGQKDPGRVVIDEIAGVLVALFGLPFNLLTAAAGFVVFRMFDIWKPFPIGRVDAKFSGGVGVVLDDVVAGIFANLFLRVIFHFMHAW